MSTNSTFSQIEQIIADSSSILVLQADNPDGDSLSSSLALEEILGDAGKAVHLYCGVDIPSYLRYLPGWDRVAKELPAQFDSVIIVDAGTDILFEQLDLTGQKAIIKSKPSIIIDHHTTPVDISWASVVFSKIGISTTELIYELAKELNWKINITASELLAVGILSDSLGLTSESTTANSLRVLADLVDNGVNLAKLENARRATLSREPELVHYKGRLLQRIEYLDNDRIALLTIPWDEIEKYSPLFNPSVLAIDDMRLAHNTAIAVCLKTYPDGKITGKIRCNYGYRIGAKLAEHFGGGGHPYAAGFKIAGGKTLEEVKAEVVDTAKRLLDENPADD